MLTLPKRIIQVLRHFETVLSERVWQWAQVLLIGAILAPGERTVAVVLQKISGQHDGCVAPFVVGLKPPLQTGWL